MGDHDLLKVDKAEVKFDKYVTMLRVKYGFTNDQAKKEIIKRMAGLDTEQNNSTKIV